MKKKYQYSKEGLERQREYGRIGGIKSGKIRNMRSIEKDLKRGLLKKFPEAKIMSDLLKKIEIDMEPIECLILISKFRLILDKISEKKDSEPIYNY